MRDLSAALLAFLAAPAAAQVGNPSDLMPRTPGAAPTMPVPHELNPTDRLFVQLAAAGSLSVVSLGRLADAKAQSDLVKSFARMMVDDHGRANMALAAIARRSGISVPNEPGAEHAAIQQQLESIEGDQFDLAYIDAQIADHQKAALLLMWEIDQGQDPTLKLLAREALPSILQHLRVAQEIKTQLSGQAAREPPPAARDTDEIRRREMIRPGAPPSRE